MNLILFDRQADAYRLDARDRRFEHVRGVLRLRAGDVFDVGVENGPLGKARIEAMDGTELRVEVEWGRRPPPPPPVFLLVGLCRPATVRKILATAPTLGVREILFAATGRTDPAYARASLWTGSEWRRHLLEGVEQAFDTHVPPVQVTADLATALAALPADCLRLALDVYAGAGRLSAGQPQPDSPVCLAIGPERGWSEGDRQLLRGAGFQLAALDTRVLRVETAVVAGLAVLLARMGVY